MKTQYTLLSGETVEFATPSGELGAFLRRVLTAARDPAVSHGELSELVHGLENPLLDRVVIPGGAIATAEVYRNPLFHAMLDCVAGKRLSPASAATAPRTRYAMTVPEAAKQLGISESAVRQAIYANRLRARKDGGTYYLDPRSVASYRVSRRGPRRHGERPKGLCGGMLEARMGLGPDASFRMKHNQEAFEITERHDAEWTATVPGGWRRVAVLGTSEIGTYYWEIEPAAGESVLQFEGFYVRGGFRVVEAVSVAQRAAAAFKAFEPR